MSKSIVNCCSRTQCKPLKEKQCKCPEIITLSIPTKKTSNGSFVVVDGTYSGFTATNTGTGTFELHAPPGKFFAAIVGTTVFGTNDYTTALNIINPNFMSDQNLGNNVTIDFTHTKAHGFVFIIVLK